MCTSTACIATLCNDCFIIAVPPEDVHQQQIREVVALSQNCVRCNSYLLLFTDITASEWCQQQYALALTARLPDVSVAPYSFQHSVKGIQQSKWLSNWDGTECDKDGGHGGGQDIACCFGGGSEGGCGN